MSAYARKYSPIVKDLLLQRVDLTTQTMIEKGYGWRLAAVIHYLRKKGWTHLLRRYSGLRAAAPKTGKVKGATDA